MKFKNANLCIFLSVTQLFSCLPLDSVSETRELNVPIAETNISLANWNVAASWITSRVPAFEKFDREIYKIINGPEFQSQISTLSNSESFTHFYAKTFATSPKIPEELKLKVKELFSYAKNASINLREKPAFALREPNPKMLEANKRSTRDAKTANLSIKAKESTEPTAIATNEISFLQLIIPTAIAAAKVLLAIGMKSHHERQYLEKQKANLEKVLYHAN